VSATKGPQPGVVVGRRRLLRCLVSQVPKKISFGERARIETLLMRFFAA